MKLHTNDNMSMPPIELIPADSTVEYKAGQGIVITDGKAVLVGASQVPSYICVGKQEKSEVPVIRVQGNHTYAVPLSITGTALAIGDKVTHDADAIRVTSTTASGVAEIIGFDTAAKAAGDLVYIRY